MPLLNKKLTQSIVKRVKRLMPVKFVKYKMDINANLKLMTHKFHNVMLIVMMEEDFMKN